MTLSLFFQWLPGRPPQTIGDLFKDRLDLTYEVANSDQFRKHRAIKILKPTTELSGMYRCKVSSFVDEDFMQKPMIVYGKCRENSTYIFINSNKGIFNQILKYLIHIPLSKDLI